MSEAVIDRSDRKPGSTVSEYIQERRAAEEARVKSQKGLMSKIGEKMWDHPVATLVTVGAIAVGGVVGGGEMLNTSNNNSQPNTAQIQANIKQLESLPSKFPNVLSVQPDAAHPGLEQVTYKFTEGHSNISDVYATINPDQVNGGEADGYNGGSSITHFGDTVTVDVDPATNLIVANPDLPPSAQSG